MKVAVVGSRDLVVLLSRYIPKSTKEIISGGARGVDTCARNYAFKHGIAYREYLPDYKTYGRKAPLIRNRMIVEAADIVLAFWDGESRETKYVIDECKKRGKLVLVYNLQNKSIFLSCI